MNNVSTTVSVSAILEEVVRDIPGWSPHDELVALNALALASVGVTGDYLELGSWCGRSAVALGLAARVTGAHVDCIDIFPERADWRRNADGSYSMRVSLPEGVVGAYEIQTVWADPFERQIAPLYERHNGILDYFRETVDRFKLTDVVRTHRGTSVVLEGGPLAERMYRLAFVDGDHGYDAVCRDIRRIVPRLSPGGWLCFDDAFTSYEGVDQAIRDCVLSTGEFDYSAQMTRKMFCARKRRTKA